MQRMCHTAASHQPERSLDTNSVTTLDKPYLWIKIADEDVGTDVQILLVRRCLIHPHLNITLTESFLITSQYLFTGFPKSLIMFMIFIE